MPRVRPCSLVQHSNSQARAFHRQLVEIGGFNALDTLVIAAEAGPPNVVGHDDQNIRALVSRDRSGNASQGDQNGTEGRAIKGS